MRKQVYSIILASEGIHKWANIDTSKTILSTAFDQPMFCTLIDWAKINRHLSCLLLNYSSNINSTSSNNNKIHNIKIYKCTFINITTCRYRNRLHTTNNRQLFYFSKLPITISNNMFIKMKYRTALLNLETSLLNIY